MLRKISNEELANLPSRWENPTCDTTRYIQNVCWAFECDKKNYEAHKRLGGICQKHRGKYYAA